MSGECDIWWVDPECHDCKDPNCKHGNWTRNGLPIPKEIKMSGECDKCGEHALECKCCNVKNEVIDSLNKIGNIALEKMKQDKKNNSDSSSLTYKAIHETLKTIEKCEYFLDILLTQTEEVGGFCSFYPKECQKYLETMKTILEIENGLERYRPVP